MKIISVMQPVYHLNILTTAKVEKRTIQKLEKCSYIQTNSHNPIKAI